MMTPASDPGFVSSPVHGLEAQTATLLRVVPYAKQRRTALDIGAHIGTWTCGLGREFARVIAFEPQEENFRCLVQNARGLAEIHKIALGVKACRLGLEQHGTNSGCWRVTVGSDIEARALDSYGLQDVDFMKLDVEGFEGHVLLGAVETIRRSRPAIFFEDNNLGEKLYGDSWIDPKPLLKWLGYAPVMRIRKDELWTYKGKA
jgi:FkbM family methyltransferase